MAKIMFDGVAYGMGGGSGNTNVIEMTQAEYDALTSPDPETIYFITDANAPADVGETDISGIGDGTITGAIGALNTRGNYIRSEGTVNNVYNSYFNVTSLSLEAGNTYLIVAGLKINVASPDYTLAALIYIPSGTASIVGTNQVKGTGHSGGGLSLTTVVSCETDITLILQSYGYQNATFAVTGNLVAIKLT